MEDPDKDVVKKIHRRWKLKGNDVSPIMETEDIPQIIRDYYERHGLKIHKAKKQVKSTITVMTTKAIRHTWKSVGKTWVLQ